MLPILLYNNMEGGSNSLNNTPNTSFGIVYDESIILNCVRNRKKVSELPNCPVCSCTIRQGELDSHLLLEVERLQKLSSGGTKRKLSATSSNLAVPGSSTSSDVQDDQEIDVSGCPGSDVYQVSFVNIIVIINYINCSNTYCSFKLDKLSSIPYNAVRNLSDNITLLDC